MPALYSGAPTKPHFTLGYRLPPGLVFTDPNLRVLNRTYPYRVPYVGW